MKTNPWIILAKKTPPFMILWRVFMGTIIKIMISAAIRTRKSPMNRRWFPFSFRVVLCGFCWQRLIVSFRICSCRGRVDKNSRRGILKMRNFKSSIYLDYNIISFPQSYFHFRFLDDVLIWINVPVFSRADMLNAHVSSVRETFYDWKHHPLSVCHDSGKKTIRIHVTCIGLFLLWK